MWITPTNSTNPYPAYPNAVATTPSALTAYGPYSAQGLTALNTYPPALTTAPLTADRFQPITAQAVYTPQPASAFSTITQSLAPGYATVTPQTAQPYAQALLTPQTALQPYGLAFSPAPAQSSPLSAYPQAYGTALSPYQTSALPATYPQAYGQPPATWPGSAQNPLANLTNSPNAPFTVMEEPEEVIPAQADPKADMLLKTYQKNQRSALDPKQRLAKATDAFLQLARETQYDKPALVKGIEEVGVKVLDAQTHPWVRDVLNKKSSSHTLLFFPTSFIFEGQDAANKNKPTSTDFPEWKAAQEQAETTKQPVLLVDRRQADFGQLLKQAFIILQIKSGLPAAGDSPDSTKKALRFLHDLEHNTPWYKQLYNHFVKVPIIKLRESMGWIKPATEGPGQALRIMMDRYIDTANVMLANRQLLGLNEDTSQALKQQRKEAHFYQKLSYDLDRRGY